MSYILAALKKADQEREIGAVPNLETPHEEMQAQTRSYRWLWIIVPLLSVNIVLVVMLLKSKAPDAPVAAQVLPERQAPLANDQLALPNQQKSEAPISKAPAPEKPVQPENEPKRSGGEVVVLAKPAYSLNSRASIPPEEESAMQPDALTTAKDNSQLHSWYELPQEMRNNIDLPRLDMHVYSEIPQKRFILVNLKKYREGETLASGLVLEEVLPDGMVMSYRGERFLVDK